MEQRKTTKDSSFSNQTPMQIQSLNQDSILIEEEVNKLFNQARKITSEIKKHNDEGPLSAISLEQFIMSGNLFFDSKFTNVSDKKILFAAFSMVHQYFLSSNYLPIFEHMLPFSTLWETFRKAFNLLDFDTFKSNIDEVVNKIKLIIDESKEKTKEDSFVDDYDDIVATFSLLFQCLESIDSNPGEKSQSIEKCYKAIDNTFIYINEIQSISTDSIHEIRIQLTVLQQILKSYQKACSMIDYVKKIDNVMLSIPSAFDVIKFNQNSNITNDVSFLSKIIKSILDFYSVYFKLMVNVSDWKEARSLFVNTQEIYMLIEQPFLLSSSSSSSINSKKAIKNFVEKIQSFSHDRSFKDTSLLKELSAAINFLPSELFHIRSSLTYFMTKRREVASDCNDTQKIFSVYQACVNFASQLRPSNGAIYNLTYRLLQIYSKSLLNSVVSDNLDTVALYLSRINMNKNLQPKMNEQSIIKEISIMLKLTQDFVSCGIVSDEYKDFMNRFQLLVFFLNSLSRLQPNTLGKALINLLQHFPNFHTFKITKACLNKDLNSIFQLRSEMVAEHLSQFESEGNSEDFTSIKKSIDSVYSAFGHYGQIIKDIDLETINQFNKYYRFKKCLEDFTIFLPKDETSNFGKELLIEPNEFTQLITSFLEKMQIFITEKLIFDANIRKLCFDISIFMIYPETANPETIFPKYLKFLKNFNICSFKQKLQISFRYIELFVLMKNENEIEHEDTENVITNFADSFISFCSSPDESSYEIFSSLYPSLKTFITACDFYGFEIMFDTIKKFDDLLTDINQINSIYFHSSDYQNSFNTHDMIVFSNMIESFISTFEKFMFYKVLSKDSTELIKKIMTMAKEIIPISLFSYLVYINPELEKLSIAEIGDSQPEDKKGINIREFIKSFSKLLSDLHQTIEFVDYQKVIKDELSIYATMFQFYLNFCPELKFLTHEFNEFIQLSDKITTDFSPILFRMLKVINIIYSSIKQVEPLTLEITVLFQINQKVHSLILNALGIISISKDLKIILNTFCSISTKYQIEDEKLYLTSYSISDFFNYQKINSDFIKKLFRVLQELYQYDSSTANSPEELEFADVYDVVTSSLPILNNLFDESTPYFVKNFFTDGCKKIDLLTKKLESNIASITNKISEEKHLLKNSQGNKESSNNNNNNNDDDETMEMIEIIEQKEKQDNLSLNENENDIDNEQQNMNSFENSFESVLNMYKTILDKKIKQNDMIKKNIDELKAKIDEHKIEFLNTNQELTKYTQILIPSEFEAYSHQVLEPLKNFQSQETEKSESSNKTPGSADDDSQFDIFSGSEFNSMFVNTILMKIEELDQQNVALSRYINIQAFYSTVDEYIKNHKKNQSEPIEYESVIEQKENEAVNQPITTENDNDNENNEIEAEKIVDSEKVENDDNDDEYEYEYEYVDDDNKKDQYDEFEQDEIKLIMMINSLRNCGKNKSTLKEIVSSNFKESMAKIELEFYRLIEKAGELFNVDELNDDDDDGNQNGESLAGLLGNDRRTGKSQLSDRNRNLLKFAKSMVQKVSSDDN